MPLRKLVEGPAAWCLWSCTDDAGLFVKMQRPKRLKADDNEQLFEEGEMKIDDKNLGEGSLTTYKELCTVATELGQPELIYRFLNLAGHQKVWNSRRGAAFGSSTSLASLGDSRDGREFIASIAKMLVIRAYVAHERLPIGQLYVLRRGLVVKVRPRTPACICAPADTPAHPHTRAHNRRVLTPCPLVCILSLSALCAVVALPRVRQGVGGGHGA